MTKKLMVFVCLPLLLLGCVTSVTNLTSTTQPRNANNLYLIEYQWDTTLRTIKPDSIKPFVMVGFDSYEMRQTPKMTNRWEVLVPIPRDKSVISYWFKVDYEIAHYGKPAMESRRTPEYKLYIK